MPDTEDEDGHRSKRFKYQSYNEQLRGVHAPSALERSKLDEAMEDEESLFHGALSHWMQLNLAPSFLTFAQKVLPSSRSLPLLVHSWREVTDLWLSCVRNADDEAMKALLDLLQKLVEDIRTTISPAYEPIMRCLFELLPLRLPPQVLSVLLGSLLAMSKHVMIPLLAMSEAIDLLSVTWEQLTSTLIKCNSEIQRATAEVWSSVLRRLKTDARLRCVQLMMSSLTNLDDFVAWSLCFAAKSVAQTVHPSGPSFLNLCLDYHLSAPDDKIYGSFTLLRRFLTALVHHCSKSDQFSVVMDPLTSRLASTTNKVEVKRILDLIVVPCSVRQGSRLSPKQISAILDATRTIELNGIQHSVLSVLSSSLVASPSDVSVWMGSGRRAIEHAWSCDRKLGVMLTGTLLEVGWKGHSQLALPPFMKNCLDLLVHAKRQDADEAEVRIQTLHILSRIAKNNLLKGVDDRWRSRLADWMFDWLGKFVITEESVIMLHDVSPLLSLVSSQELLLRLIPMAEELGRRETDVNAQYLQSWANETFVFGHIVRVIASGSRHLLPDDFDSSRLVYSGIERWSWSEYVIEGIAELAKLCRSAPCGPGPARDIVLEKLIHNGKSHSHVIRRSSLELLSLPFAGHDIHAEVIKRCLDAERVPVNIQGAKERVLLTEKIGQVAVDEQSARISVSWLLGQLKVGLRPLWASAGQALSALADRFPDILWDIVFADLKETSRSVAEGRSPLWLADDATEDEIDEDEKNWRDPSAHKLRIALGKWTSTGARRAAVIEVQKPRDRFDITSYEVQLLVALGGFPSLAEKHSREFVPLFLSSALSTPSDKPSRLKLIHWLQLFAKFSNPKALYQSEQVHRLYLSLLSHPDRKLQSAALSCIRTFNLPGIARKSDTLTNLLDDTKLRDEITMLDLHELTPDERDEFVPILIRLFYGMMRERGRRVKGTGRRSALLGALASCTEDELNLLVELMVEPFREEINVEARGKWDIDPVSRYDLSEKQQIGFLTLLADVLRIFGTHIQNSWSRLFAVTLFVAANAQRELQGPADAGEESWIHEEDEEEMEKEEEIPDARSSTRMRQMRLIRQLAVKRLVEFFRLPSSFDFSGYMQELYRNILSPRIPLLDRENTQAPSSLLELFSVWTMQPDTALYLVQHDQTTLTKIFNCLVATNVKPSVQMKVFDILERLLEFSTEDESFADAVIKPYIPGLLGNMATAVERSLTSVSASNIGGVSQREIAVLSRLSPYIEDGVQAATLLSIFLPLLRKTGRGFPEKSKVDVIDIVRNLIPLTSELIEDREQLLWKTYETLSYLFQQSRGRQARLALVGAFNALAKANENISFTADLLTSLNSYSTTRIDEPDFDQRLTAFAILNEQRWTTLTAREWTPILHNVLYFIQDDGELSIRSNAALSIKRFLEVLSKSQDPDIQLLFTRTVFPGLKRSLRTKSDQVRSEVMGVLQFATDRCFDVSALQEMRVLLAGGDEEASFFNNIFHIQVHRRSRALRRLADFCDQPGFRSSTLQEVFIPVVNAFISETGKVDHHLVNEAIITLGRIAKRLSWPAYYDLVQQYVRLATEKNAAERTYIRSLVSVLDNFHFSMEETLAEGVDSEVDEAEPNAKASRSGTTKIHDAVVCKLLPTLLKHMERRDELEDTNRIPLAIGIAKISLHLPEISRGLQVTRLLTGLSQIFRSKSQETRDSARETLCRIAIMLGSAYLPTVVRQLRDALVRGPHLHVLAYVAHDVLVHVALPENATSFDNLDDSVSDFVHVSAEVIFGESKKDVESEGFKTKMKEVKSASSKGMDSFAILARYITPAATSNLLLPIKAIMRETESARTMQTVDEVLRRIAVGINANGHFGPSEILIFCRALISQNARFFHDNIKFTRNRQKNADDATVQLKRKMDRDNDHYSHNSWRFVVFGLDIFNAAYRRGRFDLKNSDVLARLEPMVNTIGNTLYSSNGAVVASGLKAAAQIAKAPLKNMDKSLPIFIRQALQIVRETGSTEADVVQTALKTLAIIIRDIQSSLIKEKDLTFLLDLVAPDLEDAARQSNAFALLRAIVSRKFVVPEIYDLMARVAEIMVTSQSPQIQELCRSALLQFLLEYPQGKNRLRQQFSFLVKNLSYTFESGRKSVLELLNAAVMKFNDNVIVDYADMLFIALVLVLANDDSAKCREMSAQLMKLLVERLRDEQKRVIMSHVHSWASQEDNAALARVSSHVYGLILDALGTGTGPYLGLLLEDVTEKIRGAASGFDEVGDDEDVSEPGLNWQVPYQALTTLAKVFQHFPETTADQSNVPWVSISSLLLYPHAWVRTASCRLLGTLFSVSPVVTSNDQLHDDGPLSLHGMRELAHAFSLQLKSENLDEGLALQIVKNLFYVGKCFYAVRVPEEVGKGKELVEPGVDNGANLLVAENIESESEGGDEGESPASHSAPLPWLFSRLSFVARSVYISRVSNPSIKNWSRQLQAIFQWFAAMASHMESERLERFLPHILSPVYRIMEDHVVRDPAMEELKTLSTELLDLLQSKLGVTTFSLAYSFIRQRVMNVRQERKTARILRRTIDPTGAAERKMRRNAGKRKRGKEKMRVILEKKMRTKVSKHRKTS